MSYGAWIYNKPYWPTNKWEAPIHPSRKEMKRCLGHPEIVVLVFVSVIVFSHYRCLLVGQVMAPHLWGMWKVSGQQGEWDDGLAVAAVSWRYGMVWCGNGMVLYEMGRYSMISMVIWYGNIWYSMVIYGMVWYGMVWWQLSAPTDLLIAQLPDGSPKSPKCPINCSSPNYLHTVKHSNVRIFQDHTR